MAPDNAGCDTMNMGSLRAELMFPPKYTGSGVGSAAADASDGELDEDTMILGTTPQVHSAPVHVPWTWSEEHAFTEM